MVSATHVFICLQSNDIDSSILNSISNEEVKSYINYCNVWMKDDCDLYMKAVITASRIAIYFMMSNRYHEDDVISDFQRSKDEDEDGYNEMLRVWRSLNDDIPAHFGGF